MVSSNSCSTVVFSICLFCTLLLGLDCRCCSPSLVLVFTVALVRYMVGRDQWPELPPVHNMKINLSSFLAVPAHRQASDKLVWASLLRSTASIASVVVFFSLFSTRQVHLDGVCCVGLRTSTCGMAAFPSRCCTRSCSFEFRSRLRGRPGGCLAKPRIVDNVLRCFPRFPACIRVY